MAERSPAQKQSETSTLRRSCAVSLPLRVRRDAEVLAVQCSTLHHYPTSLSFLTPEITSITCATSYRNDDAAGAKFKAAVRLSSQHPMRLTNAHAHNLAAVNRCRYRYRLQRYNPGTKLPAKRGFTPRTLHQAGNRPWTKSRLVRWKSGGDGPTTSWKVTARWPSRVDILVRRYRPQHSIR